MFAAGVVIYVELVRHAASQTKKATSTARALALLSQASQAGGPALVAATGATMTTTAARQLLRGRSPFRGEWEHIPCSLFGERMRCAARVEDVSKKKKLFVPPQK
jgi:hypothetical protein